MKSHWRVLLSLLPQNVERKMYAGYFKTLHDKWVKSGKPLPPSHYSKQMALKQIAQKNNIKVLVETGTHMGDMIYAMQPFFRKLYSIELSPHFYNKAVHRFKDYKNVHLMQGDSALCMNALVEQLHEPALFWLDGHYSGGNTAKGNKECPIYEELTAILKSTLQHVIVIDDARLFIGEKDYPTVEDLNQFLTRYNRLYTLVQENDGIIIYFQ